MGQREARASFGQRLLWLLQRSVGASGALNCPMLTRIRGPLDSGALADAMSRLAVRHEALRTTFAGSGHRLTQIVHPVSALPAVAPAIEDLTGEADPVEAVHRCLADELGTQIDFRSWPTRTRLWRLGDDDHVLCLNMHHLVTDAWSCGLLYRELAANLATTRIAPPPRWQYVDFAAWQSDFFDSAQAARYRDFWTRQLTGMVLPAVPLTARPPHRQRTTATARRQIAPAVTDALRRLAREQRTTLFAVMLGVYFAALHRRTGQDDLAVTSLFANRGQREVADTVGFLANMVVLRTQLPKRATFTEVVRRCATAARDAFVHERLPYQLLPIETANTSSQRAEDVVFQMLGEPISVTTAAAGLRLEGLVPRGVARFDLELAVIPHDDGLQVTLFYASDRLERDWAETFADDYVNLAAAVSARPEHPVSALPICPTKE